MNSYPKSLSINQEPTEAEVLFERLTGPQPTLIGIEGGPCGGKSTLVEAIVDRAKDNGQEVYVLPEVATRHILKLVENGLNIGDLAVNDREGYLAFQAAVLGDINQRIITTKQRFAGTDTLIISDRVGNKPYVSEQEYQQICARLGYGSSQVLQDYVDKVIYLPSVAKVAPELYMKFQKSNKARYESLEEAQATCDRTLSSVAAHPELCIVADGYDFEVKMQKSLNHVFNADNEYEAKFTPMDEESLVKWLAARQAEGNVLNEINLTQTYHRTPKGMSYRLRAGSGEDRHDFYHFAVKQPQEFGNKEQKRIISEEEYAILSQEECVGWLIKKRFVVLDAWQLWHCDYLYKKDGTGEWVVEAEVSHPDELLSLHPPVPLQPANSFNTELFAKANVA